MTETTTKGPQPITVAAKEDLPSQFLEALSVLNRGLTIPQLDAHLAEVVEAARSTGKIGKLTLEIEVKPDGPDGEMVHVSDKITAKIPQPDRRVAIFYTSVGGRLQREDPRQTKMF